MNVFSALSPALIHSTWQIAMLTAISFAVRLVLRSSNERYVAAMITLALQLLWPVFTLISLLDAPARTQLVNPAPVFGWLPMLWLLGASLMLARLGGGLMTVSRWVGRASEVELQWRQRFGTIASAIGVSNARYLVHRRLTVPMTVGFFRPVVLLPVSLFTSVPVASLEMLVAHELMHVRRWDYAFNILQSIIEAVLFFHPAVWWVSKWARDDRELCCDEGVVARIGDAHGYASALLALAHHHHPASSPALAATGGSLMNRIKTLLNPRPKTSIFSLGAVLLALGAGAAFAVTLKASSVPTVPASEELKPWLASFCADLKADACRPEMAGLSPEDRATVVIADLGERSLVLEKFLNQLWVFPAHQRADVLKKSLSVALDTDWHCEAFDAAWEGRAPASCN